MSQPQNLFIGSLAYATTDESLTEFFAQVGPVKSARVMRERDTNRSRGFGFVEFENEEDNQKAVDQLNGQELDGRAINVQVATPREDRPRREFGGSNGGGGRNDRNSGNGNSFRQRSW